MHWLHKKCLAVFVVVCVRLVCPFACIWKKRSQFDQLFDNSKLFITRTSNFIWMLPNINNTPLCTYLYQIDTYLNFEYMLNWTKKTSWWYTILAFNTSGTLRLIGFFWYWSVSGLVNGKNDLPMRASHMSKLIPFHNYVNAIDIFWFSYPGRANFSYISLQNLANGLHEKQKVGSARRVTRLAGSPFCDGRVTLLAGPTFPHINTLARLAGSTLSRWDNQCMIKTETGRFFLQVAGCGWNLIITGKPLDYE